MDSAPVDVISNLDDAVRYATRVLGLELVRRDRASAYMRSDSRRWLGRCGDG
jgi:hypothetical protein